MFIFPRVGQSLSFSPCHWWPACWGAVSLPLPQTAKRAGKLAAAPPSCWNLSLCVYYNILHFFCPFQNNKPLAILVILNSSPLEEPTPLPLPPRFTRTHARRDFKRKWIHVLFCFFSWSFTKVKFLDSLFYLFIFFVKIKSRTASWLWL